MIIKILYINCVSFCYSAMLLVSYIRVSEIFRATKTNLNLKFLEVDGEISEGGLKPLLATLTL